MREAISIRRTLVVHGRRGPSFENLQVGPTVQGVDLAISARFTMDPIVNNNHVRSFLNGIHCKTSYKLQAAL